MTALRDIVDEGSSLDDLTQLLENDFEIDIEDIPVIYSIGKNHRTQVKNFTDDYDREKGFAYKDNRPEYSIILAYLYRKNVKKGSSHILERVFSSFCNGEAPTEEILYDLQNITDPKVRPTIRSLFHKIGRLTKEYLERSDNDTSLFSGTHYLRTATLVVYNIMDHN